MNVGEDGSVGVYSDVTGDRIERLDCGWTFSWHEYADSHEEDRERGEVISWVDSLDDKLSKVVWSSEKAFGVRVVMQLMYETLVELMEN